MEHFDSVPSDSDDDNSPRMFSSLGTDVRRKRNRRRELYSLDDTSSRGPCDNQTSITHSTSGSRVANEETHSGQLGDETDDPYNVSALHSSLTNSSHPRKRKLSYSKSKSCSDIASLESAIDKLYKNYTQCRNCHQTNVEPVFGDDGRVLMMQCKDCQDGFGVDDTMTPDMLFELYQQGCIEVQVGCCENTNPDLFKIEGIDGEHISVRCGKCDKLSVLSNGVSVNSDAGTKDSLDIPGENGGVFECKCGNQDQTRMEVCVVDDEIRCVTCTLCEEFIKLPEVPMSGSGGADEPDPSEFVTCKCRPGHQNIKVTKDSDGEIQAIECTSCNYSYGYVPKDDQKVREVDTTDQQHKDDQKGKKPDNGNQQRNAGGPGIPRSKTWGGWLMSACTTPLSYLHRNHVNKSKTKPHYREVKQLSDLQRADHIMWDRYEGYGHHAIIEHVLQDINKIVVIHYNGPSPSSHKIKGEIIAEKLDPFAKGLGRMFVVEYANPLPPDEVIKNASSRLGEVEYSLVSNNCEHFATWCKTGQKLSSQVITVQECFMKYATECSKAMVPMSGGKSMKVFGRYGVVVGMAAMQIQQCINDIQKATADRKDGRLTREAYIEVVVKRVTRGMGGLGGLALGMRIPVPIIGPVVGGTLGGMIGEFAGKQLGTLIVKGYNEVGNVFRAKKVS